jgi:hypothetical protein
LGRKLFSILFEMSFGKPTEDAQDSELIDFIWGYKGWSITHKKTHFEEFGRDKNAIGE